MLNLSAKILSIYGIATEMYPEQLMSISWGKIPSIVKGEKVYENGRLKSLAFHTKLEDNGTLSDQTKCFSIWWDDIEEVTINNASYIKIRESKRIELSSSDISNEELKNYTVFSDKKVEKSKLYRYRRADVINQLKAKSINTSIEESVAFLSTHFETEINRYINDGTNDFQNAILNEKGTEVLEYLDDKLIIGFDGVIGKQTGTTPLYYRIMDDNNNYQPITLKRILLSNQQHWKNV